MSNSMRKITYYENVLEFKENTKEPLNLHEVNNWKLCRTCLTDVNDSDVDLEKMVIMDVMEGSLLTIKEMLNEATNIRLVFTEELPSNVCKECFSKITASYYFAIQVRKAEKVLRRLNNKLNCNKDVLLHVSKSEKESEIVDYEMVEQQEGKTECNKTLICDDRIYLEVEELFDFVDDGENTNEEIEKETNEPNVKSDSETEMEMEGVAVQNDNPDLCREVVLIESECTAEEDCDSKSTFSEGVDGFEKDLIDDIEASVISKNQEKVSIEDITINGIFPMSGYKHKQPRVTSPLLKENTCAVCQETFDRQQDLVSHVRDLHPTSKAYKCRVCNKLFSHIQSLSRHMNSHKTSVVMNGCEYCDKTFMRIDDLKRHLRVHTGERPYVCPICQKSFQQLNDMKIHERKHSCAKNSTRVFKCRHCKDSYPTRSQLHLHTRTNHPSATKMKYDCSYCEKSFSKKPELKEHESKHFLPNMFQCNLCNNNYKSSMGLYMHRKRYHKEHTEETLSQEEKSLENEIEGEVFEIEEVEEEEVCQDDFEEESLGAKQRPVRKGE